MYYLLDDRPSCCGPKVEKQDELVTHDLLTQKAKHLHIVMAGILYDIAEAERLQSSSVVIKRYKQKHATLQQMYTNVKCIQTKLEEAALYGSLTSTLKSANLTLDQMLERVKTDDVDRLMDCIRDQSGNLQEIQELLSDPLQQPLEMSSDEEEEEQIPLVIVEQVEKKKKQLVAGI